MTRIDARGRDLRPTAPEGRPSVLDEAARGRLMMALAAGLSQREAGVWVGCGHSTISFLVHKNEVFAQELEYYTELARLDPHLCIYRLSSHSWHAAAALVERLERRHGPLTTDRLLTCLELATTKAREVAVG